MNDKCQSFKVQILKQSLRLRLTLELEKLNSEPEPKP